MERAARRLDLALLVLALVAAVAAGLFDLGEPWDGSLRGVIVSTDTHRFVRNHLELGLEATRGGCVILVDPLRPEAPYFYGNHPATSPLLMLPFAALFGDYEDTLRVACTAVWLVAVLALWRLARRWLAEPGPGAAALLFATLPMNVAWGPSPHMELAVLPALTLAVLAFVRQLEGPGPGRAALLGLAVLFACLTDWPGVFVVPLLLVLAAAWPESRRAFGLALRVAPLAFVAVALIHAHTIYFLRTAVDPRAYWLDLFRATQDLAEGTSWVRTHVEYARDGLGPLVLALVAAGAVVAWRGGAAGRRRLAAAGALMLPGLLNVLLFRDHAVIHPFWGMFGTAGVALLAAVPCAGAPAATVAATVAATHAATRAATRSRLLAGASLAAVLLASGLGLRAGLLEMSAWRGSELHDLGVLLDAEFGPGDVVASSVDLAPADLYVRAALFGPVRDVAAIETLGRRYALPDFGGRLAFALPERESDGALARHLRARSAPRPLGRWLLFELR